MKLTREHIAARSAATLPQVYRIEKIYVSDAISERERSATHEVITKKTY